jgi:hypothetical protein
MSSVNPIVSIDPYDRKIIIDLDELETAERLEGAHILKTLFNINDRSGFSQDFEMKKNDDGNFTILKDYNLSAKQWNEFIYFIRTGRIKYIEDIESKEHSTNKRLFAHINDLYMGVFGVFGPIHSFDRFCENIVTKIKEKERNKIINPMNPEADIYRRYYWTSGYSKPFLDGYNFPENTIWNVAGLFPSNSNELRYYRSLIANNVETQTLETQPVE